MGANAKGRQVMTFAAALQRRMLLAFLGVLLVLYTSAVFTTEQWSVTRGEMVAVLLCAAGLAFALPTPLRRWRYLVSVVCLCVAPIVPMIHHDLIVAQVWALIPLMFAAIYIRVWHRPAPGARSGRAAFGGQCGGAGGGACSGAVAVVLHVRGVHHRRRGDHRRAALHTL
ncbi:hypothetical protein [Mycolicibacterium hippocampi]|uniref:Uncharacterized protein n=2 Tax=Mycobacteriaceae TaxID=1762 RepID=A0A850PQ01_9MYCO|nr:hypothetical protein [Mycolicibacterium hippocampi]NVN50264.1 hypothetical protein [Mycolicibacterium hippocampi]